MDCQILVKMTLLKCVLFLCLSGCLCQKDCTGVDCPVLDRCIKEVLESGSCCTSCVQTGCTCEGYQYYDCVNAGFNNGKVPEGESYLVDFGSTECSCPQGGGRISCHFIPCPELPPNCIEASEPSDGCVHCARIGCVHNDQKYEAGHSVHMDPCQVCHCPNDGGSLMCYVIPDCDPKNVQKPMLATTTEGNQRKERYNGPFVLDRQAPVEHFSKPYSLSRSETLPLFKHGPSHMEEEDYDYSPTDTPEQWSAVHVPAFPTGSSISVPYPETSAPHNSFNAGAKQELREVLGLHEDATDQATVTDSPVTVRQTTSGLRPYVTTPSQRSAESPMHSQAADTFKGGPEEDKDKLEDLAGEDKDERVVILKDATGHNGQDVHYDIASQQERNTQPINVKESSSDVHAGNHEKVFLEHSTTTLGKHELHTFPTVTFSSTTQPPLWVNTVQGQLGKKQSQTLFNVSSDEGKEGDTIVNSPSKPPNGASAKDLLQSCCEAGHNWASEHYHCNHMPAQIEGNHPVCSVAQMQCCSGFVKESRCLAGMNAARGGDMCQGNEGDRCGAADSYQECCRCCALGLQLRSEGRGCEAHQHLGYPCGHVFLTCCETEDDPNQPTLKRKERPTPTSIPKRVSDGRFPSAAFSISDSEEAANSVEEAEDVDECQLYAGQLCHQVCVNTWGSYRCACHQGYVLLQDGHTCVPENADEDNRVKEEEHRGKMPAPTEAPATPAPPTEAPTNHNPCTENGSCMQQCTVVGGEPRCFCFPGYTLMADGRLCEDVNECLSNTHRCHSSERCVNTVGSFVCERQIQCKKGHQLRNGVCEDVNECALQSHNCGVGFECQNTDGSFLCNPKQRCLPGFTQDTHGNCIDINECSSLSEPCNFGFNCINTVGSYTCQRKLIMCSQGYHSSVDGARCIDVDECQTGIHRCREGQICHNLPGSYRCDCQTGYQYDAVRQVCVDVNECWRYPGRLCAQTCENSPGSYQCTCTAGFSLAFDGKNCEDLNECDKNPCSQECANIYGSYQCYCRQGFYLKEDGHTCEDIDECSQSVGNLCTFQCVNIAGSYQCACPPQGYSMSANGRTCRDIDECTTGSHNCSTAQSCYNIQGSFRCLSFACPPNYKKVSDMRCERISCPNVLDCQSSPLRITYYQLSFQTNIVIPAQIFRIGPSTPYSGDNILIRITQGNEENYFSTRKLNGFTGAVYLQRQLQEPRDFLIDVEMKLLRQGTVTTFLARIYVFITAKAM